MDFTGLQDRSWLWGVNGCAWTITDAPQLFPAWPSLQVPLRPLAWARVSRDPYFYLGEGLCCYTDRASAAVKSGPYFYLGGGLCCYTDELFLSMLDIIRCTLILIEYTSGVTF